MLLQKEADEFAQDWIASWNTHDLERVLAHYHRDVEFTSPTAVKLAGIPSGTLHGRDRLRPYFMAAFQRFPNLEFRLDQVLPGMRSVVLYYLSMNNQQAAELMELDEDRKITRVLAHYTPA